MIATVTAKGQVTLPVKARQRLGIRPGCKLEFVVKDDNRMEVIVRSGSIKDLKGVLLKPKKTLSLKEMEESIVRGAARSMR